MNFQSGDFFKVVLEPQNTRIIMLEWLTVITRGKVDRGEMGDF